MKRKRIVLPLLVFVLAAVLPIAVFAQAKDTVVIRGIGNISTFNPLFSSDGASYQAYALLWPKPIDTGSFADRIGFAGDFRAVLAVDRAAVPTSRA